MQPNNMTNITSQSAGSPQKTALNPETKHGTRFPKVTQLEKTHPATADQNSLPDPEFRNAAGNVTRKRDSTVRAEPPPTNTGRAMSQSKPQQSQHRRTTSNRLGNDSDSDSSSDSDSNRKLGGNEDGAGVARRRKRPAKVVPGPSLPNSQLIEQEERERTQLLRALRDVADKWVEIHPQRKAHEANRDVDTEMLLNKYEHLKRDAYSDLLDSLREVAGEARETALQKFSEDWDDPHGTHNMQDNISRWSKCYNDFLDEALYGDVEKKLLGGNLTNEDANKPTDHLEDVIGQVERAAISRCSAFDPARRNWGYLATNEVRLAKTLQALNRKLCTYLSDMHDHEKSDKAASMFIQKNLPLKIFGTNNLEDLNSEEFVDTRSPLTISIDTFVDRYLDMVVCGLVDAFLEAPEDDPLVNVPGSLRPIHVVKTSRRHGHMTREYIEWACSKVPQNLIEQCCVQWQKNLRVETARQYRVTMDSIIKIEQEFCLHIVQPNVVSLVLFKGNYPVTLRTVSAAEMHKMGWFGYGYPNVEFYWRWESVTLGRKDIVRAVSMDKKVLGMWTPRFGYFQG